MQMNGPLAALDKWQPDRCSIALALDVIGTRSALLLLREAFYGTTRFDGFVRRVGITEAVAAKRLKELVDAGLFEKRPYQEPGARTRHEYVLTEQGSALLPVIVALMQWGDTYLQPDGGPLQVVSASSAEPVTVHIGPSASPVAPDNLAVELRSAR
ncbi:MAG: hypothetical protein QOF58_903 [Pseudonocardiales bacterium]|jgi:DNA-binding HxlR family transcriptional regulator|nr:hypothetical protein [Pseudonocardiales bacterium]